MLLLILTILLVVAVVSLFNDVVPFAFSSVGGIILLILLILALTGRIG